jgi:hypothetical protein
MKKMKVVYVVRGSEDGILGVYGNKKMAYEEAVRYATDGGEKDAKVVSYSKVCRELKDVYNYSIDVVDDTYHYGNAGIHAVPWNERW